MKMLIYVTKGRKALHKGENCQFTLEGNLTDRSKEAYERICGGKFVNGLIPAVCDVTIEEIVTKDIAYTLNGTRFVGQRLVTKTLDEKALLEKSCLSTYELIRYLNNNFSKTDFSDPRGYAIHIDNFKVYKNPKKLSDFVSRTYTWKASESYKKTAKKPYIEACYSEDFIRTAPQNMMYAYKPNDQWDEPFILCSIRPEWAYKIFTKEKTIEIRKKILKRMCNE